MPNSVATSDAESTMSTDTSANATLLGSSTPTGTVIDPGQERSGTVLGQTQWDSETQTNQQTQLRTQTQQAQLRTTPVQSRGITRNREICVGRAEASTPSTSTSRPETETGRWRTRDGRRRGDESGWGDRRKCTANSSY